MKRVFTATCLAAAFAVGLAAQQQSTATTQETQQQRGPRSVTITGCLRAGDTAGTYVLTDVTGLPAMRRGTTGTTASGSSTTAGTETGTTGAGNTGTSATLTPAADVDLAPHVGHKIEVTGTMGGRNMRDTGTTGSSATSGAGTTTAGNPTVTTAQGQNRPMPHVNVTSVRMISESCS